MRQEILRACDDKMLLLAKSLTLTVTSHQALSVDHHHRGREEIKSKRTRRHSQLLLHSVIWDNAFKARRNESFCRLAVKSQYSVVGVLVVPGGDEGHLRHGLELVRLCRSVGILHVTSRTRVCRINVATGPHVVVKFSHHRQRYSLPFCL